MNVIAALRPPRPPREAELQRTKGRRMSGTVYQAWREGCPKPPDNLRNERRHRAGLRFAAAFFGSDDEYATPRSIHVRSAALSRYPEGATSNQPGDPPRPLRVNGFAPGSRRRASVWAGSTRTMRSSSWTPTHMFPPRRNAMPPNI